MQGDTVHHVFRLKNETGQELEVLEVKTIRGVLTYDFTQKQIPEGDSFFVKAAFPTTGFCGRSQPGLGITFKKFPDGTDGDDSRIHLGFDGLVLYDSENHSGSKIVYDQKIFDFGTVPQSSPLTVRTHYKNEGNGYAFLRPEHTWPRMILDGPDSFIHPGDTGSFLLAWQSDYMEGDWEGKVPIQSGKCQPVDTLVMRAHFKPKGGKYKGMPELTLHQPILDLGVIGPERYKCAFTFQNTGKAPLIFQNVKTSCGCLVPDWPKEPIAPGECGVIRLVFYGKGREGPGSKSITMTTNCEPQRYVVRMKYVVKKDAPLQEDISPDQLKIQQEVVDFGTVPYGESSTVKLRVQNCSRQRMMLGFSRSSDVMRTLLGQEGMQPATEINTDALEGCHVAGRYRMPLQANEKGWIVLSYTNHRGGNYLLKDTIYVGLGNTKRAIPFQVNLTDTKTWRKRVMHDQYGFERSVVEYQNGVIYEGRTYIKGGKPSACYKFQNGVLQTSRHWRYNTGSNIKAIIYEYDPVTGERTSERFEY